MSYANTADLAMLDAYDVAYALYDGGGRQRYVSESASAAMARHGEAAEVWRAIASIIQEGVHGSSTNRRHVTGVDVTISARTPRDIGYVVVFQPTPSARIYTDAAARFDLTAREREVAMHIARGRSTKEIAAILSISQHTARHHTERLYAKLGVHGRAEVMLMFGADRHNMAARPVAG